MSLIKYTLFKLLRYIYLLPSVVLLLWVKKQSNFQTKSKGYDDFLKNGEDTKKTENDSYIFSDKFNLSI